MNKYVTNVLFAMSLLMTNQIFAQNICPNPHKGCDEIPSGEIPCGFTCTVCRYEPEYYDVYKCEYENVPHQVKKCRYVSKSYQKKCCRYVPEYYYMTCTIQVPEYYDDIEYVKKPKWVCEKQCKMVPKYYNKPLDCQEEVCETVSQPCPADCPPSFNSPQSATRVIPHSQPMQAARYAGQQPETPYVETAASSLSSNPAYSNDPHSWYQQQQVQSMNPPLSPSAVQSTDWPSYSQQQQTEAQAQQWMNQVPGQSANTDWKKNFAQ